MILGEGARPRVSVLIVNYNYGRFLRDALESVRAQTFTDREVVVADDGSTDNSRLVCEEFADLAVRFVTGEHVGLSHNLQRGLSRCRGALVAFLSADDIWLSHHLASCVSALDAHPPAAVAYSSCVTVDESGAPVRKSPTARRPRSFPSGKIDPEELLPSQFIATQAAVVKRDALLAIGGFDTSLHYTELDLFIRLITLYPIIYTNQTTVRYRQHHESLSRDHERALAARIALYEKHLAHSPNVRRRLVAHAHSKTAYRQLKAATDRNAVANARRNITRAIRLYPRTILRPLSVATLAAAMLGRFFLPVRVFYERRLADSRLKITLQKVLLMHR